jgi:hypothetical protein
MPSFFETADSTGVVEEHIQEVLRLEKEQSETILKDYGEVRRRLVERLSLVPAGSFTAQHLRGVLAQVQGAIEAMNSKLQGEMISGAQEAAMSGIDDLLSELKVFDEKFTGAVTPINLNSALLAHDTSQFLVTKYKTNLDAYGNDLMTQIANGLFSATIGETSYDQVVGRISKFFTAEEWKLRRIVRTELHNIYNVGKINGMKQLRDNDDIPDLMKTLMHPLDQRTGKDSRYAAQLGLVEKIEDPFKYEWAGELRVFMAPPDRPNDRAILVPFNPEWGRAAGEAFVPGRFPVAS